MKKLFTLLTIALSLFMVSCDEDVDKAVMLSGQWRGDFGACIEYGSRKFYADYSDVVFYPSSNYSTHGTGRQVNFYDTYDNPPVPFTYEDFLWEINNGRIYLTYPGNPELDAIIDDYYMNNNYFSGVMNSNFWVNTSFKLYKISGYYDWDYYEDNYSSYYYAKSRSVKQNADSTVVDNAPSEIRVIREFKNKQK